MIPKKIHYCWFGRGPLSDLTLKCIESWKKFLPDYEIIQWNEDNFDVNSYTFSKEAYEARKYAFVADICRLDVLHKFGGIYLDTDMELLKPLSIISPNFISGFEDSKYVGAGIIISPKEDKFVTSVLEKYRELSFNKCIDKLREYTIPKIFTDELVKYGLKLDNTKQVLNDSVIIYPSEYFYPLNYFTGKLSITEKTMTIHHYDSSWMSSGQKTIMKLKIFLISIFGTSIISKIIRRIKRYAR
ncbi:MULTISPECIES: glycosyltransferase family 32 protein [Flavobacterium]|uniref:glycosyltransferase family 32 protein n=1 Tax=Flavobacterium TaxID=237 RepID=UPI001FCBA86C|nr:MULTISPECIES: glycosyltransferase [Flavobacterium]UOK43164.1 glycosyl transferase [Flavobacterium enshiense]